MSTDLPIPTEKLFHQLLDGSDSHIALVDLTGVILAVNTAWVAFGLANGLPSSYSFVGQNYLRICESAAESGYKGAVEAYVGLQEVLRTGRPKFTLEYPCHSPTARRWFRMWVEPQFPQFAAVIVAHKLIAEKPLVDVPKVRSATV